MYPFLVFKLIFTSNILFRFFFFGHRGCGLDLSDVPGLKHNIGISLSNTNVMICLRICFDVIVIFWTFLYILL